MRAYRPLLAAVLLLGATAVPAQADRQDRRIRLINASSETIQEFHASNTSRSKWEEDILGRRVLPPGASVIINLDDGSGACRFDFKTVMESGRSLVKRNIDVCRLETYRITD